MFIYRIWALLIIAHLNAASSSSQKPISVLGASKSIGTRVTSMLQNTVSQPVPMTSPVSPKGPATRRIASIYSASAPVGPAGPLAIASPRRLDLPGFGSVLNFEESELSQSVREPHLKSTRKGRIDELLNAHKPVVRNEKPFELENDNCISSEESIEAASDLDDYFGAPTESSTQFADDDNF